MHKLPYLLNIRHIIYVALYSIEEEDLVETEQSNCPSSYMNYIDPPKCYCCKTRLK